VKTPVTIRDVAARCGCSQPTVSLALSNSPRLPAATRLRVQAVARQMSYRTHPLVAAHMRSRRQRATTPSGPGLALINAQLTPDGWRHSTATVLRQMYTGAMARARERGYSPQEFWLHREGLSHARLSDILRARGISGLLVGPGSNLTLDLALEWDAFASVQLGSAHLRPTLHRVMNDHYQSAMLAVQECHRLDYRRPGLVLQSSLSASHEHRWEAGYLMACRLRRELSPPPTLYLESMDDRAALLRWIKRHRPDVVIEATERTIAQHLASAGYVAPAKIGVVTLGSPVLGGPISGAVQDGHAMGANAIDLLIGLVERNETGIPARPITQMTASVWNEGKSVRAV
jgi:LacI family transcriptional regulator